MFYNQSCRFILNPSAFFEEDSSGRIRVRLPYEGLEVTFGTTIIDLLTIFSKPQYFPHKSFTEEQNKCVYKLINLRLIIPNRLVGVLKSGITSNARVSLVENSISFHDLDLGVAIIGSAVDFAQISPNTSFLGPQSIRFELKKYEPIQDIGNIAWFPEDGLMKYGERLSYAVTLCISNLIIPIVLGGDHSLSFFTIKAAKNHFQNGVGIIHFDAHNDFGEYMGVGVYDSPITHANVFAHIATKLNLPFIVQIGLRKSQLLTTQKMGQCSIYQLEDSKIDLLDEILDRVVKEHNIKTIYLSIDVDCINPKYCSEVTTPLEGGISPDSLINAIFTVGKYFEIVSADIVEVCGVFAETNNAAKLAGLLVDKIRYITDEKNNSISNN
jgi:arginase family enzyme